MVWDIDFHYLETDSMNHLASSLTSEHLPTLDGLRRAGLNDLAQLCPKIALQPLCQALE